VTDEPSFEEIIRRHYIRQGLELAAKQCERLTAFYDPYSEGLSAEQKKMRREICHALSQAAAKIMELK
jgi:hypothetical protein